MNSLMKWLGIALVAYIAIVCSYIFFIMDWPSSANGGDALLDPLRYVDPATYAETIQYAKLRYAIALIKDPLEIGLILLFIATGLFSKMEGWIQEAVRRPILQHTALYWVWSVCVTLLFLPFYYYFQYYLGKVNGLVVQSLSSWFRDELIDFWVSFAMTLPVVLVILAFVQKQPRRWPFSLWLLSIPFTFFLVFVQPVFIDPLYDTYTPIQNVALEKSILELADKANIPAEHVYEVNRSAKTETLNAYVTGIGDSARIVLWDTTLQKMTEDEIAFVMAHEMGHYVYKHIYWHIALSLAVSLVGLFLSAVVLNRIREKSGFRSFKEMGFVVVPILFAIWSALGYLFAPVESFIVRQWERSCDAYAISLTNDPESGITAFQKLAKYNRADVSPPPFLYYMLHDHPSITERIQALDLLRDK
ncbi:MAG: M48 family metallopeptidase [Bacilli bacterium]